MLTVVIHRYKGVGKTSLAQTAAFQLQSSDAHPIIFGCGEGTSFDEAIHEIVRIGLGEDPRVAREVSDHKIGAGVSGSNFNISAERRRSLEIAKTHKPSSVNEAVGMIAGLVGKHSAKPIILIDEFDKVCTRSEQAHFAEFIKQLSDQHVSVHFIFCGVGESIDDLMKAHSSVNRYLHPIKLDRLAWDPRIEIVERAANVLGVSIDRTTTLRICRISDGFPHYIHLIAEKLFWLVFEARNGGHTEAQLFEAALQKASDALEPELKSPYERATKKYTNNYEHVLFAVADDHMLQRRSSDIYASYLRIMVALDQSPLSRDKFNGCINRLKQPAHAEMLVGSRSGWYEFREKVIRGYARLRAAQEGVELEVDHPAQPTRFSYRGV